MKTVNKKPGVFTLSSRSKKALHILMALGVCSFLAGLWQDASRAWHSYLTSYFYFSCLALGGFFFTAVQHIAHAGWVVNIRRVCESLTAYMPMVLCGAVPLVLGGAYFLFTWMDPQVVAQDPVLQAKSSYLNMGFWTLRLFTFSLLWWFFSHKIVGLSIHQDGDGQVLWTQKMTRWSVAFVMSFALSFSLFSVDLLMSLEPHWFSTIFGVYCFAGAIQSALAFIIIMVLFCRSRGWVEGIMTIDHVHDVAKYLKGFTVFWAYIAFSQYMLIWYANIPEETIYYLHRSHGGWVFVSLSLLVFKFIFPFIALLPRWAKRTPSHLMAVCLLILLMQYVDIFWMVYPNYSSQSVFFSWQEVGPFLGFLGLFLFLVTRFLSKHPLIPLKDPRIHESMDHHVTY